MNEYLIGGFVDELEKIAIKVELTKGETRPRGVWKEYKEGRKVRKGIRGERVDEALERAKAKGELKTVKNMLLYGGIGAIPAGLIGALLARHPIGATASILGGTVGALYGGVRAGRKALEGQGLTSEGFPIENRKRISS